MPNSVFSFHTDDDPLASSLSAFLQGDPQVREELPTFIHKKLVNFARLFISSELAEDAVQQMWLLLLRKKPSSFDPSQVTAWKYLQQLLRTAARDVRASCTPPGQHTRPRKDSNGKLIENEPVLSLDVIITAEDSNGDNTLYELITDMQDPFEFIDAKIDVEWLLNDVRMIVPQSISATLKWMYENDAGLSESATQVGISRFQLHRGINQLKRQLKLLPLAV